jgi:hypothetical protein
MKNGNEDLAGTNPFDAASLLKVSSVGRPDANNVSLAWSSVSGKTYQVQSATTPGGPYSDIGSPITANGATTMKTVAATTPAFYRVRVVVP